MKSTAQLKRRIPAAAVVAAVAIVIAGCASTATKTTHTAADRKPSRPVTVEKGKTALNADHNATPAPTGTNEDAPADTVGNAASTTSDAVASTENGETPPPSTPKTAGVEAPECPAASSFDTTLGQGWESTVENHPSAAGEALAGGSEGAGWRTCGYLNATSEQAFDEFLLVRPDANVSEQKTREALMLHAVTAAILNQRETKRAAGDGEAVENEPEPSQEELAARARQAGSNYSDTGVLAEWHDGLGVMVVDLYDLVHSTDQGTPDAEEAEKQAIVKHSTPSKQLTESAMRQVIKLTQSER